MSEQLPVTETIAAKSAGSQYGALPVEIRAVARQCILDWFGVTPAGAREELSQIIAAEALAEGGDGVATLVGLGKKAPPLLAALVNGTTSHALDYDDVHLSYIGHTTVAVLPAILALGEARGGVGARSPDRVRRGLRDDLPGRRRGGAGPLCAGLPRDGDGGEASARRRGVRAV